MSAGVRTKTVDLMERVDLCRLADHDQYGRTIGGDFMKYYIVFR